MSDQERYGFRNAAYSAWHRPDSVSRYIDLEQAQLLGMIDLDVALYLEFDRRGYYPVALVEVAVDVGQDHKCASVTQNLARLSELPAVLLLYKLSPNPNPTQPEVNDIQGFRFKKLYPLPDDTEWRPLTVSQWINLLIRIRKMGADRWQRFLRSEMEKRNNEWERD